jgi:hypothetical protein
MQSFQHASILRDQIDEAKTGRLRISWPERCTGIHRSARYSLRDSLVDGLDGKAYE